MTTPQLSLSFCLHSSATDALLAATARMPFRWRLACASCDIIHLNLTGKHIGHPHLRPSKRHVQPYSPAVLGSARCCRRIR